MTGTYLNLTNSGATGIAGPQGATGAQGPGTLIGPADSIPIQNAQQSTVANIVMNMTGIAFIMPTGATGPGKDITFRPQYGAASGTYLGGNVNIDLGPSVSNSTAKVLFKSAEIPVGYIDGNGYFRIGNLQNALGGPGQNGTIVNAQGIAALVAGTVASIESTALGIFLNSGDGSITKYKSGNVAVTENLAHNAVNTINWAAGVSGVNFQHSGMNKIRWTYTGLAFNTATPVAKPIVSGVKVDTVAGSILAALVALGLVTDQTT